MPPSPAGPGICPPPVHAGEVQREWDIGVLLCPLPLQALTYALHQFMQGRYRGSGIEGCYCAPFPYRPWCMPSTSSCRGGTEGVGYRGVTVPPSPAGPDICPPPVHAGEVQREWDRGVLLCPLPLQALTYALHQFMQGRYRGSGIEGCYCAPFPYRPWHNYALHQFMQGRYRGSGIEGCYSAPFPCRP